MKKTQTFGIAVLGTCLACQHPSALRSVPDAPAGDAASAPLTTSSFSQATPAAPAVSAPQDVDTGAASPLELVSEGWEGGPEIGSQFQICPVEGALFACGDRKPAILRPEGFVEDDAIATGLPNKMVLAMTGRWPEATWLLAADPDLGNWSFGVYRWRPPRWVQVLDVPSGSVGLQATIGTVRGVPYVRIEDSFDPSRRKLMRLDGPGSVPTLPRAPAPPKRPGCDYLVTAKEISTGSAAMGWCGADGQPKPFVLVLEGSTWTEVDPPPADGCALDYEIDDAGDWMIVGSSPRTQQRPAQLFPRLRGATWAVVPLPPRTAKAPRPKPPITPYIFEAGPDGGQAPYAPLPDPRPLEPVGVQSVGGDLWVWGFKESDVDPEGNMAVVMRARR